KTIFPSTMPVSSTNTLSAPCAPGAAALDALALAAGAAAQAPGAAKHSAMARAKGEARIFAVRMAITFIRFPLRTFVAEWGNFLEKRHAMCIFRNVMVSI